MTESVNDVKNTSNECFSWEKVERSNILKTMKDKIKKKSTE